MIKKSAAAGKLHAIKLPVSLLVSFLGSATLGHVGPSSPPTTQHLISHFHGAQAALPLYSQRGIAACVHDDHDDSVAKSAYVVPPLPTPPHVNCSPASGSG